MNNIINYDDYYITSTSQFDRGLSQLKSDGFDTEVKKIFKIIDEIIQDEDMYELEYSRPLENSNKIMHIHLDGRTTGDIILLYTVNGKNIDLDLKLYNITDHKDLSRVSKPKFTKQQALHPFDVIVNKYTEDQRDYCEQCYLNLISDYRFYQVSGERRKDYSEEYLRDYFDNTEGDSILTYEEFLQVIQYFENKYKKKIYGSINFSIPEFTPPITSQEEQYILSLFDKYSVYTEDAYVETEVDEYGDRYEYMYVETCTDNYRDVKLLESELYSLETIFEIHFSDDMNGKGRYGKTYEFSHYFA